MNTHIFNEYKPLIKTVTQFAAFALIIWSVYILKPWFIVEPGFAVVHTRWGKIIKTHTTSGLQWKIPLSDAVVPIDMRIKKSVIKTEAFSHDLQVIDAEVAINHRVLDPEAVYTNIGQDYDKMVIDPFTQESVKAIIATFSAEALTQHRNKAKEMVKEDLRKSLEQVHIQLVDFNFIHADFHDDFIKSVESKQIAEQRAKQAKFETDMTKEIAIQKKEMADADAYSLKVQKEMATPQLALLKAIEKWDGQLPKVMSSRLLNMLGDTSNV